MPRVFTNPLVTLVALAALAVPSGQAKGQEINASALYQQTLKGTVLITFDQGSGSGWLVDAEKRLVVTNHHVAGDAKNLRVYFPRFDKGELVTSPAEYVGNANMAVRARLLLTDPKTDLAVIEVDHVPAGAQALPLATRSSMPAERVHALGNPGASGALWVYSVGNVRAVYRQQAQLDGRQRFDAWVIETSLPTNPGDSGGPEVNDQGQVVGVTSHHFQNGRLITDGIDIREVKSILADVQAGKRGVRGVKPAAGKSGDDEDDTPAPKAKKKSGDDDEDTPAPKAKKKSGDDDEDTPAAPKSVKGLLEKAAKLTDAKKLDEALAVYAQVLKMDSDCVEAYTKRAWIFNEQGEFAAAVKECTKALQVDEDCAAAYRERGFARLQLKQFPAAVKDLTAAIRLNPKDYNPYVYRSKAERALGDDDAADADLAKAKKLGYRVSTENGE